MNLPDKELKELLEKYIKKSDRLPMDNVYEVKVLEINQELKNREELRKKKTVNSIPDLRGISAREVSE